MLSFCRNLNGLRLFTVLATNGQMTFPPMLDKINKSEETSKTWEQ